MIRNSSENGAETLIEVPTYCLCRCLDEMVRLAE